MAIQVSMVTQIAFQAGGGTFPAAAESCHAQRLESMVPL